MAQHTVSYDPITDVLRRIRTHAGMSLGDVERKSDGRWKAVVVGSYERGDRRPTVEAARELLGFYLIVKPRDGAS